MDYWPDLYYQAQVSSSGAGIKFNKKVFGLPHYIHTTITPIHNFRGLVAVCLFFNFTTRDLVFWIGDFQENPGKKQIPWTSNNVFLATDMLKQDLMS